MKKLKLIILFLLFCLSGFSTTYYVDKSGNDTSGDGSVGNPWLTVKKATSIVWQTGDVIHVNTGTYIENVQCNLNAGVILEGDGITTIITSTALTSEWSPILSLNSATLDTRGNEIRNLKFDGGNLTAAMAIWASGRSNVKIHDCTFVNFNYTGVFIHGLGDDVNPPTAYATGCEFYNNIVDNCAYADGTDGSFRGGLNFGAVEGMLVYNNNISQIGRADGYNGDPIKISAKGGYTRGCKIYNNTISRTDMSIWTFCIEAYCYSSGLEIYENTIIGSIDIVACKKDTYDYGVYIHNNIIGSENPTYSKYGIVLENATSGSYLEASDVIIQRNTIRNCIYAISIGAFYNMTNGNANYNISYNIFKNLVNIYNQNGAGVHAAHGSNFKIDNFEIYNNVFDCNTSNGMNYGIYFETFFYSNSLSIKNNILQNFLLSGIYVPTPANIITYSATNNIEYLCPTGGTNPLFVSDSDFHLQAGSPAINSGVNVGLTTDYIGNALEGIPDIGAYEYITPYVPPIIRTKGISAGNGKAWGKNGIPYGI